MIVWLPKAIDTSTDVGIAFTSSISTVECHILVEWLSRSVHNCHSTSRLPPEKPNGLAYSEDGGSGMLSTANAEPL